ncbi:serine protease snake-like, partial [Frankliniella occidentalis]|uniref:Serine protease snake-like n=1 Tax=Frankliniella occidentalis TaxID=133901 RepID=A0A9C6XA56_FRAOC
GLATVEKVIVHPEYRPGLAYADLAVVRLNESYDLRDYLPLCLNTEADFPIRVGVRATAAGWNTVGTWEEMSLDKPNNTLAVRSSGRCSASLLKHDRLRAAMPEGYVPSLLCAGGLCDNETYAVSWAHPESSQALSSHDVRWALLGATNRTSQEPKAADTHQLIEVAQAIVHPEYVATVKYHDIALVRLAQPARMKKQEVYPACLDTDMDVDNTGRDAVATGWGATSFEDDGSQSLLKVNLTVRDMQYCRDNLELDMQKVPRGLEDATQLCAGGGEHNRDTCQGDSGGPLQMRANPSNDITCIYRIVGVVSFGPPCGLGKPGIYTRVASYVPWIESVVWPPRPDGCVNNLDQTSTIVSTKTQ